MQLHQAKTPQAADTPLMVAHCNHPSSRSTCTNRYKCGAAWAADRSPQLLPVFAALTLIPMLAALIVFWPIPYLRIAIDAPSGIVLGVAPGSAADRAVSIPGDRVLGIYDYAWQDADRQPFLFPLVWPTVSAIPMQIERGGVVTPYLLPVDPPDIAYQLEKVAAFGLGLICWLVGYLIGIVQRHDSTGTPIVAWFWMGLGALVGCSTFALYSSYPRSLVLRWLLLSVVAPVAVFMHVWFPVRSVTQATARRARRWSGSNFTSGSGYSVCRSALQGAAIQLRIRSSSTPMSSGQRWRMRW